MMDSQWTDWVPEAPFEVRFQQSFLDFDGPEGPYHSFKFCGLKAADFVVIDRARKVLYLLEVKSAEWFMVENNSDWDAKVCDLFRCFFDTLGACARLLDPELVSVRDAARQYRVQLIVFTDDHPGTREMSMVFAEPLKRYLHKKLRALDIESDVFVETLSRQTRAVFEARTINNQ